MSWNLEKTYKHIEFEKLLSWIDLLDQFVKNELSDFVCFIHTHGAFPDRDIPQDLSIVSKGKRSFLIFGNQNQFFKLNRSISLMKAVDAVGNYGIVKFYIVSDSDEQAVTEAIKQKKMGFYHFNSYIDDAFLSSFVNLKKGFIEIETSMESRRDSRGKELTYLKIFKADSLPQLPTVLA